MTATIFPLTDLQRLRERAATLAEPSEDGPEGWSISSVDPMKVVAAFGCLSVKEGYALRAYQFRQGGNGNGVVWAMPADAEFPAPERCSRLRKVFLQPPKPPKALPDVMKAIDGDGTPWSYLCASILGRELVEFGAMWHGCSWSTHRLLGSNPMRGDRQEATDDHSLDPAAWTWHEAEPAEWQPQVTEDGEKMAVAFFTHSGLMPEGIFRHKDTFRKGSYSFKSQQKAIATGHGGYVS